MLPLLPFAAGLVTGAVAIKMMRNQKTRAALDNARDSLRKASVSGLARLESSTAAMRERLSATDAPLPPETAATPVEVAAPPEAKPPRRRKTATKAAPRRKTTTGDETA